MARRGDSLDYNWNVSSYVDLLFWQNARAAARDLKRARSIMFDEQREDVGNEFDPLPLIHYLEARDPQTRLKAAIAVAKGRWIENAWLKDIASELVAAGVDPQQSQLLLKSDWRRR